MRRRRWREKKWRERRWEAASEVADRQRAERVRLEMERLKRVRADTERREKEKATQRELEEREETRREDEEAERRRAERDDRKSLEKERVERAGGRMEPIPASRGREEQNLRQSPVDSPASPDGNRGGEPGTKSDEERLSQAAVRDLQDYLSTEPTEPLVEGRPEGHLRTRGPLLGDRRGKDRKDVRGSWNSRSSRSHHSTAYLWFLCRMRRPLGSR